MQDESVIGHALAKLACVMKGCNYLRNKLQCSIGMKSGTLSLTSPSQRILSEKLRYPCFSQVSGSDCPLSCLYCICRFNSLIATVLLSAGFRKYRAQITPIIDLYCIIRSTYWFLQFFTSPDFASIGLDYLPYRPIDHGKYITLIYILLYFHDIWNDDKFCLYYK